MKYLPCVLLGVVLIFVAVFATPKASSPRIKELVDPQLGLSKTVNQVVSRLNQVCSQLSLPEAGEVDLPMVLTVDRGSYGVGQGSTFELKALYAYRFTFLQSDGSLVSFINDRIYSQLYGKDAPFYDKPRQHAWTEKQATEIGAIFLKAFTEQIKVELGKPSARYDNKVQNGKYYVGEWTIWWPRIDSKGHPFSDDRVTIQISEGYAPTVVMISQKTPYIEEKGIALTGDEALKKVRQKIANDHFWDEILSIMPWHRYDGWVDLNPTNSYWQIVTPRENKNMLARVAWVFWFKMHTPEHTYYPISYWIDAHTGKVIGGDVVGLDTPE